jgi:hypothetical protein
VKLQLPVIIPPDGVGLGPGGVGFRLGGGVGTGLGGVGLGLVGAGLGTTPVPPRNPAGEPTCRSLYGCLSFSYFSVDCRHSGCRLAPWWSSRQNTNRQLYYRAQAYLDAGEHAKAVDEFKAVIAHRGRPEWGIFAPLAQLGLARAYALQGNLENSRKAYDDFFTTWKEADPDIPILRQASAEYKKLTATASVADSALRKM